MAKSRAFFFFFSAAAVVVPDVGRLRRCRVHALRERAREREREIIMSG